MGICKIEKGWIRSLNVEGVSYSEREGKDKVETTLWLTAAVGIEFGYGGSREPLSVVC